MRGKQTEQKQRLSDEAYRLFREFRSAYTGEWRRLENCERMYRGDHWHDVPQRDPNEPRPVTPVIQSTVENISAELMDRIPEAVIAPETPEDAQIARVLEAVIRQNHDLLGYAREYRRIVHDLLVSGYAVQEVGFDPSACGGLGCAYIRHVDARSILFDPAVTDLQDGRAVFKIGLRTRAFMEQHFPEHAPFLTDDAFRAGDAAEDEVLLADRRDMLLLIEAAACTWRSCAPGACCATAGTRGRRAISRTGSTRSCSRRCSRGAARAWGSGMWTCSRRSSAMPTSSTRSCSRTR